MQELARIRLTIHQLVCTVGRARAGTEKATCGFPEAVVSADQTPPSIRRPYAATVLCVFSPCAHIQHGYMEAFANGVDQVRCIQSLSAETGDRMEHGVDHGNN